MASSVTLANLRDRVEESLMDSGNTIWSTTTLDEAIRHALDEYFAVLPLRGASSLALTAVLSANGREIDISGISGLVDVIDVWGPYVAADDKPKVRKFDFWLDQQIVYVSDGEALETTETARIFYTKQHTLNGLDGASATTFRLGDDSLIVLGATGYACFSRATDLIEQVKIDQNAVDGLRELGKESLTAFRSRLVKIEEMLISANVRNKLR